MAINVGKTVCSTMFCYNWVDFTENPAKPPFCDKCKEKSLITIIPPKTA